MSSDQHSPLSLSGDSSGEPPRRDVTRPRAMPNKAWVCGYAELGKCCSAGPTGSGRCSRAVTAHEHDSLTATAAAQGVDNVPGSGPDTVDDIGALPPCVPIRSHWWRRQSLRINLANLTGGLLLLCMSLSTREKTFVPGELTSKHAQILENTLVSQRCGLCHPQSHQGADGWATDLFKATAESMGHAVQKLGANDGRQDALCMRCHKGHMPAAEARNPHDLTSDQWQALTVEKQSPAWQVVSTSFDRQVPSPMQQTSCATCHVEHHGRSFDLKLLADDSCQACHQRQFESLAAAHPEFNNFPVDRPRSLAFSHRAHADKHFPQKSHEFDCRKCHVDFEKPAAYGPVSRSMSFEKACAECHDAPIRATASEGWALLTLPSISADAAIAGAPLAAWPLGARFGYEGTISPVLHALLLSDTEAQAALEMLPASGQLAELPSTNGRREEVTLALALATKRLIRDTARNGQAAWRLRLESAMQSRLKRPLNNNDQALIESMCRGLPPDLFRSMQKDWFESTAPVIKQAKSDTKTAQQLELTSSAERPTPLSVAPQRERVATQKDSAATQRKAIPELQRRWQGGLIIERKQNGLLVSEVLMNKSATAEHDNDSLLTPETSSLSTPKTIDAGSLTASHAQESLLSDEPFHDHSSASDELVPNDAQNHLEFGSDTQLHSDELQLQMSSERPTNIKGAVHVAGGGWYLDQTTLAVKYMPTGHADETLAAWSLWWSMIEPNAISQRNIIEAKGTAQTKTSHAARLPGGCLQCHKLGTEYHSQPDIGQLAALLEQWRIPERSLAVKEFTKFNHTPHLSLPAISDCRYCHVLNNQTPPASASGPLAELHMSNGTQLVSTPLVHGPIAAASDFKSMHRAQCVACHRPNGANDSCLQCHNYHITAPPVP